MRSCHVCLTALLGILISAWIFGSAPGFCNELRFTDGTGNEVQFTKKPECIVSLVPSITEMLFALGAQDSVQGITYHTTRPWYAARKTLVGGFSFPSPAAIEALEPDLVFYDPFQLQALSSFLPRDIPLVHAGTQTLQDSLDTVLRLGDLVEKQENARHLVAEIKADLDWVTAKMRKADLSPKRVIRLMGREQIMTPGRDSFQNHMISLAGGIPPDFGTGAVVPVSKDQWTDFNPQVIYGCGSDREAADRFFSLPGWKDVDAVKNNQIYYFPCDLTCRASIHSGQFVKRLFATIHGSSLADEPTLLQKNQVTQSNPMQTDISYVQAAAVKQSRILDFINKSLVIQLDRPMSVLSTLEGFKHGVTAIGNHYIPPETWLLVHDQGLEVLKTQVFDVLGLAPDTTAFLFTGADMDHLSAAQERFKEIAVTVFATAGVDGNAMRTSRDSGEFYEPGTINVIIMTSHRLTPGHGPGHDHCHGRKNRSPAGLGYPVQLCTGPVPGHGHGHRQHPGGGGPRPGCPGQCRRAHPLGELIGKAVHRAVTEAVKKQNGITSDLNIFRRLEKRGISCMSFLSEDLPCQCHISENMLIQKVETLLLDPFYRGFMATALTQRCV